MLLDILIVVSSSKEVIYSLILLHTISAVLGIWWIKLQNWEDIFYADSLLIKKESLTMEMVLEILNIFSGLMLILPSIFCHIIGLLLFIPKIRLWASHHLFKSTI